MSDWLRRDRLTNIAFRLPRSMASSAASRTASLCTWSKARATSPISSVEVTPIGSISAEASPPSLSLSLRTISGSLLPATSRASARSLRSGRIIDRATKVVMSRTRISSSSVATETMTALCSEFDSSELACAVMSLTRPLLTLRICLIWKVWVPSQQAAGPWCAPRRSAGLPMFSGWFASAVATASFSALFASSTCGPATVLFSVCCSVTRRRLVEGAGVRLLLLGRLVEVLQRTRREGRLRAGERLVEVGALQ